MGVSRNTVRKYLQVSEQVLEKVAPRIDEFLEELFIKAIEYFNAGKNEESLAELEKFLRLIQRTSVLSF